MSNNTTAGPAPLRLARLEQDLVVPEPRSDWATQLQSQPREIWEYQWSPAILPLKVPLVVLKPLA